MVKHPWIQPKRKERAPWGTMRQIGRRGILETEKLARGLILSGGGMWSLRKRELGWQSRFSSAGSHGTD